MTCVSLLFGEELKCDFSLVSPHRPMGAALELVIFFVLIFLVMNNFAAEGLKEKSRRLPTADTRRCSAVVSGFLPLLGTSYRPRRRYLGECLHVTWQPSSVVYF